MRTDDDDKRTGKGKEKVHRMMSKKEGKAGMRNR